MPRRPGVYLFQDEAGKTIYVGKSINLRARMMSYFTGHPAGVERRIVQMILSIRDFKYCEMDTELLALLLEDSLIKRELLNFEKAAKLKTELDFCRAICSRQRFIHGFSTGTLTLRDRGDGGGSYEFAQGNLISPRSINGHSNLGGVESGELMRPLVDLRCVLDRANLIHSWLGRGNGDSKL